MFVRLDGGVLIGTLIINNNAQTPIEIALEVDTFKYKENAIGRFRKLVVT